MKDKKVLVTGHTGFKGSWLCEWLLHLGARVHGVSLPHEERMLFENLDLSGRLSSDRRLDVRDRQALLESVVEIQPDFVFHLAAQALVCQSYEMPVETFETNVNGTIHLLEALRAMGRPCVAIMVSSDKCYENREWIHSYRENDPMGGHDPYSASKGASELAVASWRRSYFGEGSPIRVTTVRAGNVIGGGDWARDRIVPDCIRALQKGTTIQVRNRSAYRPWQHVLEPLWGYIKLAEALASPNLEPGLVELMAGGVNFGPAVNSNRTVAQLVEELLVHIPGSWEDCSPADPPYESNRLNLAIDKAYHLLGWYPAWNFSRTVAVTAEWYLGWMDGQDIGDLTRKQIGEYQEVAM